MEYWPIVATCWCHSHSKLFHLCHPTSFFSGFATTHPTSHLYHPPRIYTGPKLIHFLKKMSESDKNQSLHILLFTMLVVQKVITINIALLCKHSQCQGEAGLLRLMINISKWYFLKYLQVQTIWFSCRSYVSKCKDSYLCWKKLPYVIAHICTDQH